MLLFLPRWCCLLASLFCKANPEVTSWVFLGLTISCLLEVPYKKSYSLKPTPLLCEKTYKVSLHFQLRNRRFRAGLNPACIALATFRWAQVDTPTWLSTGHLQLLTLLDCFKLTCRWRFHDSIAEFEQLAYHEFTGALLLCKLLHIMRLTGSAISFSVRLKLLHSHPEGIPSCYFPLPDWYHILLNNLHLAGYYIITRSPELVD